MGLRLRGHSPQATEGGGDHTSSDPFPAVDAVRSPWHRPGGRKGAGTIAQLVVSGTQKYAFTSPQARVCARLVPEGSGPGPSWGRCFGGLGPAAGSRAQPLRRGPSAGQLRWWSILALEVGTGPGPTPSRASVRVSRGRCDKTPDLEAQSPCLPSVAQCGPRPRPGSSLRGRREDAARCGLADGAEEGWRLHSHEQRPPSPASSRSSAPRGLRVLRAPLPAVVRTRPVPRRP